MIGALFLGSSQPSSAGGIISAVIGVLIILPLAGFVLRRAGNSPERRGPHFDGGASHWVGLSPTQ